MNRYAYTHNDPVNFIDPSGLLRIQECTRQWWTDGQGQINYSSWMCVTIYDDGGLNGGGDVPGPVNPGDGNRAKLPFDNCNEFVDFLVGLVKDYAGHLNDDSSPDHPSMAAATLGSKMMGLAFFGYARHINNGYSGFKDALTQPWLREKAQGAGVYGHILGFAGAYQDSLLSEAAGAANLIDVAQKLYGTEQGPAEVEGNKAGWEVGKHMWNFISGRTPRDLNRLKNSVTKELCK